MENKDQERLLKRIAELETQVHDLKKDLIHDALTGLKTRAFFEQESRNHFTITITEEAGERRLKSSLKNLSFIFFDIDHFKKINDSYGHATGDEVLKAVAKSIERGVRKRDIVSRWGGEEFVVIMVGANIKSASTKAESIRKNVEHLNFPHIPGMKVTVSAGIADREENITFEETLKRADLALYSAKNSGRNKVVAYGETR